MLWRFHIFCTLQWCSDRLPLCVHPPWDVVLHLWKKNDNNIIYLLTGYFYTQMLILHRKWVWKKYNIVLIYFKLGLYAVYFGIILLLVSLCAVCGKQLLLLLLFWLNNVFVMCSAAYSVRMSNWSSWYVPVPLTALCPRLQKMVSVRRNSVPG